MVAALLVVVVVVMVLAVAVAVAVAVVVVAVVEVVGRGILFVAFTDGRDVRDIMNADAIRSAVARLGLYEMRIVINNKESQTMIRILRVG
jgi:hypothetical protein